MRAIYKRELQSYLTSMIGCVFIAFFIAIGGLYFMVYNLFNGYTYFSYALYSTTFFMIIGIPMITMKSFADEKKNKTEQLLMTAPISLTKIVLGKYFAMLTIFAIPNLVYCVFPLLIKSFGIGYFLVDYSALLAYYLLGAVFIAVGMFLSTLTESQVIAAIMSFVALYILYMWEALLSFLPFTTIATVLTEYALLSVFDDFAINRLFNIPGLIAYISVAGVFVFLTIQTLQKRRWS
ncbi:MAG: ABC transporter permease [Eubacteriales bacterium]